MLSLENDPYRTNIPNTRTHRVGSFDSLLATTCRSRYGIVPIGLRSSYPLDLPWWLAFLELPSVFGGGAGLQSGWRSAALVVRRTKRGLSLFEACCYSRPDHS